MIFHNVLKWVMNSNISIESENMKKEIEQVRQKMISFEHIYLKISNRQ